MCGEAHNCPDSCGWHQDRKYGICVCSECWYGGKIPKHIQDKRSKAESLHMQIDIWLQKHGQRSKHLNERFNGEERHAPDFEADLIQ
jgi:hypothetical protein